MNRQRAVRTRTRTDNRCFVCGRPWQWHTQKQQDRCANTRLELMVWVPGRGWVAV